jgi:hypothetical protein
MMRRIAVAGGLAAVALAGTAGYAVTARSGHPAAAPPQAALTTALDAAAAHDGPAAGTGQDARPGDTAAGSGAAGGSGGSVSGSGASGGTAAGQPGGGTAAITASGTGTDATGMDATGTGGTGTAAGCAENGWQPRVQGRPVAFDGGDRAGDYLWHGTDGFHLRVTHRGDGRDVFAGSIRSDAALAMRPVRLEGRDAVWLSADRRTLGFRFYDYGHIDGVDFVTRCATRLTGSGLTVDGAPLPAGRVYLGRYRVHPAQVPFTIQRRPAG